jgi:hypothetical protein
MFRGRHYFFCHPDADRDAVCEAWREGSSEAGEEGGPWYRDLFDAPEPRPVSCEGLSGLLGEVDWDFWPEEEDRSPAPSRRSTGPAHFAVDVWCGKTVLQYMDPNAPETGGWRPRRVETGIPAALLVRSVLECGGSLHFAGTYPINGEVKAWLEANCMSASSAG